MSHEENCYNRCRNGIHRTTYKLSQCGWLETSRPEAQLTMETSSRMRYVLRKLNSHSYWLAHWFASAVSLTRQSIRLRRCASRSSRFASGNYPWENDNELTAHDFDQCFCRTNDACNHEGNEAHWMLPVEPLLFSVRASQIDHINWAYLYYNADHDVPVHLFGLVF